VAGAELILDILPEAPDVTVLATAREQLSFKAEYGLRSGRAAGATNRCGTWGSFV